MSKKLFSLLAILVVASMILAACAPAATEAPPAETVAPPVETAAPAFRVGFVTDTGGIDDQSFNTTQWKGVQRAQTDLGVAAQFIQSDEATQYEPNLTEFASQGYDLVIAAGFFLGGDLAAGMTKTGKLGYFGGAKIPTVTYFGVGFQKGMELYNQVHGTNVELIGWDNATGEGLFTGDFSDLTKGKEATESLFDEGVDIFIPVGGLIGTPGFDVARERGGYGIWVDVDGYNLLEGARDVMLTSVMKNMDNSVYAVIKDTMEGKFNGCGVYVGEMANGGVGIAPYHDLDSKVPADLKKEVADLQAKIVSGEISDTGCVSFPESCPGGLYP